MCTNGCVDNVLNECGTHYIVISPGWFFMLNRMAAAFWTHDIGKIVYGWTNVLSVRNAIRFVLGLFMKCSSDQCFGASDYHSHLPTKLNAVGFFFWI